MKTQELKTVVKIHTTATSVHFLDENGKAIVKLRVGDACYTDEGGKMYICRKKFAAKCLSRHFFLAEPVAIDKVDPEEFRKVDSNRHLSFVSTDCKVFNDAYSWYSAFCSKLCFD